MRSGASLGDPPLASRKLGASGKLKKLGGSFILRSAALAVDSVLPGRFDGIGYLAQVAWGGEIHRPYLRFFVSDRALPPRTNTRYTIVSLCPGAWLC